MRLLGLHLLAYGPFTDVELDLDPQGVHVVYGKNEAGKSTALRAITGLLYGIARTTGDAHVHKMPDLRIAGRFRVPGGGSVYLVRRKGNENTLLDKDGQPVDEAVLARLLGGVSEEQFLTMFGLNHESLRRGGEALLVGKGHVGESLFGAAVAGEVHQVLRSLQTEAEGLFTPKAHTKPLNEAIRAWSEAQRSTRDASMSPESMLEQENNLAELRRERAECERERDDRKIERRRLERACRALPIVAKHRLLAERRAALGHVVMLPRDAAAERTEQQRIARDGQAEIAHLEPALAELRSQRDRLVVPESLVAHDEVPLDLPNRLGSHRKAQRDLPRIEAEARELEDHVRDLLRKAGRSGNPEEATSWRVDAVAQASIRKLARDIAALADAEQQSARAAETRKARREALATRQGSLPPAPDVSVLKKATLRAERAGPLDERLAKAESHAARIEQQARTELSALGLGALSMDEAAGLPVVSDETVERYTRDFASIERETQRLEQQASEARNLEAKLALDTESLVLAGKVPTERELTLARERRDATLQRIRTATAKSTKAERLEPFSAFETELRASDDIADRLRREAERVGKLAALLAEREATTERRASIERQRAEVSERNKALAGSWGAAWQAVGIEPRSPSEMKGWLAAHGALVRTAGELHGVEAEIASFRASIESHRAPILALLEAVGASPSPNGASLASLLDVAGQRVESAEERTAARRELDRAIGEIDVELAVNSADQREQEQARARLDDAWRSAIAPLGIDAKSSPEDVIVGLDLLTEAFHKLDQASAARRRLSGIERDAEAFAADVAKVAEAHAPDLLGRTPEEAADAIIDRHLRGTKALVERTGLDRQLADTEQRLAALRDRVRGAETGLRNLVARAGVETMRELEHAEARSSEAGELDRQLASLDADLEPLGLRADALPAEIRDLDVDAAAARLEQVDIEIAQLDERISVIHRRIWSNEEGQKKLEEPQAVAAEAALDAESRLATVRDLAERYARARVASFVLAREVERYRQKNQGPILKRASDLFARLTIGSFSGLRTAFDEKDQPILLGVRAKGPSVAIGAMSDGTRDQLYLALYLATLERFAEGNDPMPLIVDDVLIHFDDDRARAALEVLGELSQRQQVLFFTHHARLVELARQAIPDARLFVRELDGPRDLVLPRG